MKVTEVKMTPELASTYLKLNTHNRPLSPGHIDFLVREICDGRWTLNGDTICLSNDNRLVDGQHRLHAIVKSGVAVRVLLVEGVPHDVFATKDLHKRRTASDLLALNGEQRYTTLASAAQFVDRYQSRTLDSRRRTYSPGEIQAIVARLGNGIRESVEFASKSKNKKILKGSVLAGLHYVFSQINREQADCFWTAVMDGENLSSTSAEYALRERLLGNRLSKTKYSTTYVTALCILAWNYMRQGRNVSQLKYRDAGPAAQRFPIAQ